MDVHGKPEIGWTAGLVGLRLWLKADLGRYRSRGFVELEPHYRVWWDDIHDVARNSWAAGAVCRLEDARAVTRATAALGRGAVPVLVDMRKVAKIERPARQHFIGPEGNAVAVALVVGSAVSRIIGRVMVGLLESVPTRTFTDERAALVWLASFRHRWDGSNSR